MIRQSLPESFTKSLGLYPQGFSQFLKQISKQFLTDFCLSPPSISLIALTSSRFLVVCRVVFRSCLHSSLCFPDPAPTFSQTCSHNSTHFTCFLPYCPSVSPTVPCTRQPFTTSAAHTSPSNSTPNPFARLAPCQSSGLLPEVTFLYKAFCPSRLKNFTLGPPLKAIFFSPVSRIHPNV